jgi:hypothetical protein
MTDKEWQHSIKVEGGPCPVCRLRAAIHAHHLISRGVKRHRREPRNGLAVCGECHENPAAILRWVEANRPRQYQWYCEHRWIIQGRLDRVVRAKKPVVTSAQRRLAG